MSELVGRSIIISGRVQSVFYRASTLEKASKLGLMGWVKNLSDGSVKVEVFGVKNAVLELVKWCKEGPPMCKVSNLQIDDIPFREEPTFRIIY